MRRNQGQDDPQRRAREAELRQIRDATNALRGLSRAIGGGGGAGGGVVGALGSIAGGGLGGLGLAAVGEVVAEFRRTMERANRETGTIIRAQTLSGGTTGEAARTSAEFRSIGLDSGRILEVAEQFRERVWADPIARGAFGRTVIPERFGGTESSIAVLREGINKLGKESTETSRRILAARFQLKDMLEIFNIPPEERRRLLRGADEEGGVIDPELKKRRAERDSLDTRIEMKKEQFAQQIEKDPLPNALKRFGLDVIDFLESGGIVGAVARRLGGVKGTTTAAPDAQTRATQENTKALFNLKEEFANSRRAGGAVPSGLRGFALQKALDEMGPNPYWLGAFSQH